MAGDAQPIGLPFDEAIEHFKDKLSLPTQQWTDIWQGQHARAFVVAGATRSDLLSDLRDAVRRAIEDGESLGQFQDRFDGIVEKYRWRHTGSAGWRARVIYETNLRTAYAAGRYRQMTDPEVLKRRPYWEYRHGDSAHPRALHQQWSGKVLKADDKWWDTHYPPNGWGCKCRVFAIGPRDLKRLGKSGPDPAPDDGERKWVSPGGKEHVIPNGIDPGWDYNVGKAAWGDDWWTRTSDLGSTTEDEGKRPADYPWLPEKEVPVDPPVPIGPKLHTVEELRAAVPEGIYRDVLGEPIHVGQPVVDHILEDPEKRWKGREQYLPLIPHVLGQPQEVWITFVRHESGRYAIRRRYSVAYRTESKPDVVGVLVDTVNGRLVAFDVIAGSNLRGGRLRSGRLLYPWPETATPPHGRASHSGPVEGAAPARLA